MANQPTLADLAAAVGRHLGTRGATLAVVESSAGGLLSSILSRQAGAGRWFAGGVVAYAGRIQTDWLGLAGETLRTHGAVSVEVAAELAQRGRDRFGATWGLAETGIAGPQTGRRSSKPAGLGCLGLAGPAGLRQQQILSGLNHRIGNKNAFAEAALRFFLAALDVGEADA